MTSSGAARHLRPRPEVLSGGGAAVEVEYARDTWDATVLGIEARRGRNIAHSEVIEQPWLREAIKRWSRFRLGASYTFTTIDAGAQALARWSLFLRERPEVAGPAHITRELLEAFLSWMASSHWRSTLDRTPSPSPRCSSSGATATTPCPVFRSTP